MFSRILLIQQGGYLLLETVISIAIFALFAVFFISSFANIFAVQESSWSRAQASLYAQEGLEVSYNIFINTDNWSSLIGAISEQQSYKLKLSQPAAFLRGSDLLEGGYMREISFERVYRNPSTKEIVDRSVVEAQLDPDTIMVKSTVIWQGKSGEQEVRFVTYLIKPPNT